MTMQAPVPPAARLARYGFSPDQIDTLDRVLDHFRCRDTCGRRRACLDHLARASESGDTLAEKLLVTPHHDRLMNEAALAYGRRLGRVPC